MGELTGLLATIMGRVLVRMRKGGERRWGMERKGKWRCCPKAMALKSRRRTISLWDDVDCSCLIETLSVVHCKWAYSEANFLLLLLLLINYKSWAPTRSRPLHTGIHGKKNHDIFKHDLLRQWNGQRTARQNLTSCSDWRWGKWWRWAAASRCKVRSLKEQSQVK